MQKWMVGAVLFQATLTSVGAQSGQPPQDEKTRKAGVLNAELFLAITHREVRLRGLPISKRK